MATLQNSPQRKDLSQTVAQKPQSKGPVYTAFVSKIPSQLCQQAVSTYLREQFAEFGHIVDLRVTRPVCKKHSKLSEASGMWHCYVDFASQQALQACCAKSYVGCKYSFKVRPNLSASQRKEQSRLMIGDKRKVFLNGLPFECDCADLEREMSYYGTVQDVEIIPKPDQGKKIAFVIFKEQKKGEEVAAHKYLKIKLANGQELEVECQLALNPQQLHARKQQTPRKDSNDASTDASEEHSAGPNEHKSSRQMCVVEACLPKQTADSRSTFGPIGNGRVSPSARTFQSGTKTYSPFFPACRRTEGSEFKPQACRQDY